MTEHQRHWPPRRKHGASRRAQTSTGLTSAASRWQCPPGYQLRVATASPARAGLGSSWRRRLTCSPQHWSGAMNGGRCWRGSPTVTASPHPRPGPPLPAAAVGPESVESHAQATRAPTGLCPPAASLPRVVPCASEPGCRCVPQFRTTRASGAEGATRCAMGCSGSSLRDWLIQKAGCPGAATCVPHHPECLSRRRPCAPKAIRLGWPRHVSPPLVQRWRRRCCWPCAGTVPIDLIAGCSRTRWSELRTRCRGWVSGCARPPLTPGPTQSTRRHFLGWRHGLTMTTMKCSVTRLAREQAPRSRSAPVRTIPSAVCPATRRRGPTVNGPPPRLRGATRWSLV